MIDWTEQARCADVDPETYFGASADTPGHDPTLHVKRAKAICDKCNVREDCLRYVNVLDRKFGVQWGVWAGYTPRQRRRMMQEQKRREKQAA